MKRASTRVATGLNALSIVTALASIGGFIGESMLGGRKVAGWKRPRNTLWRDDPDAKARAVEKRAMRAEKLRRAVANGAYGLAPHVGMKGYVPNYKIDAAFSGPAVHLELTA